MVFFFIFDDHFVITFGRFLWLQDRFHEQEIKKLRQQLNELIEERER
jgi:hypothetical protein